MLVTYDIGDHRRRARLYELLLGYGSPVQKSVFECDLTSAEIARLRQQAERYSRGPRDSVRYYLMCGACAERTEGGGTKLSQQYDHDFVV